MRESDHARFQCELVHHGEWGVEAQFLKNEELLVSRRFDLREQAVRWAEEMRTALETGWEDARDRVPVQNPRDTPLPL